MGRLLKKKGRCSIFRCGKFHVKQEMRERVEGIEEYYICDKMGRGNITNVILGGWGYYSCDRRKVSEWEWVSGKSVAFATFCDRDFVTFATFFCIY